MSTARRYAGGLSHDHGDDWRTQAACRDEDPELFFADGRGALPQAQNADAKAVCKRCPVEAECLAWALTHPAEARHGVWGGHTADQRDKILRRKKRIDDRVIARAIRDTRTWIAVQRTREAAT